ncbi:TIGR02710 family CRISPR-associated protein [bacterium]|nr:TIGR02710 family CRISPR-associated protein [bacterium]
MGDNQKLLIKYEKIFKIIEKLADDKNEWCNIYKQLENFSEGIGSLKDNKIQDLNLVNSSKKNLFNYEKKYIPIIKENIKVKEKLETKTLLMTVGMQIEPIILSILILKPEKVYLLHTESSLESASIVGNDMEIRNLNIDIHLEKIYEDDVKQNYNIIKEIIDKIKNQKIVTDPTCGRKMMNTSLSLAAFYYRIPMVYLNGIEVNRNVVPFSERIKEIDNPFDVYGDIELELVENLYNSHFYDAAIKVCENLLESVKNPASYAKIEKLNELITIYRDWDRFEHSNPKQNPELSKKLIKIKTDFNRLGISNRWLPPNIEKNIEFLEEIEKKWIKGKLNMIDEYRIIDLFINAQRRGTEKQAKYDDAIARLYRVTEMLSTYFLLKFDIESSDYPNYKKLTNNLGISFDELNIKYNYKNKTIYQK